MRTAIDPVSYLEKHGPHTAHDLMQACGLSHDEVYGLLIRAEGAGRARISHGMRGVLRSAVGNRVVWEATNDREVVLVPA